MPQEPGKRSAFRQELALYVGHVLGLVPGRSVPVIEVHNVPVGDLNGWGESDLALLIEQGRRQVDRQRSDLERLRARAQYLFTVEVAAIGLALTGLETASTSIYTFLLLVLGIAILVAAGLGAAAVMVSEKRLGEIDSALLSGMSPPVTAVVATAYAGIVKPGEDTWATSLTVFRDAVGLAVVGFTFAVVAVLWAFARGA